VGGRAVVTVLATGDPLLYGIADFIIKRFGKRGVEIIPNVSVVQAAFARIKESARGLKVLSVHGNRSIDDISEEISDQRRVALFTDSVNNPAAVARALLQRGEEGWKVYVCEDLGSPAERVIRGGLSQIARRRRFAPLNVMILVREETAAPVGPVEEAGPGIPDERFYHGGGLITKAEIRVVALSKLAVRRDSVVWDIGSGCGSVAIEASMAAPNGTVYAVEKRVGRVRDIERNIRRFKRGNVRVVRGEAPACLRGLAAPEAVFIGGGGSGVKGILGYVSKRIKAGGAVVVNAVTMETAFSALEFFKGRGFNEREVVQIGVSKGKEVAGLTMLGAFNPVFIIRGVKA